MTGRSSAGRSRMTRGRGRGGRNSTGRSNNNHASHDLSYDDISNDENMDQHDGLDILNRSNAPEAESPLSRAQQGSNALDTSITHPSRMWISITKDRSRFTKCNGEADNGQITRSITSILKKYYLGAWPTWASLPVEEREKMFDRFKLKYCWDAAIDEYVLDIFNVAIARRLSDRLSIDRDQAYAKAEAAGNPATDDDLTPIIPYNPSWMKQDQWKALVMEHWSKDKWLNISRANRANRAKFVAGHHCTGSAGYIAFRERFEEKMGVPQSSLAFFIASHTKKGTRVDGEGSTLSETLIDERAREAVERLSEYMIERYGPDVANHPKHDQELWERATGVRKKGRAYSSGTSSDPSFVLTGTVSANSSSSYVQPTSEEVEKLKQKLEEMSEEREKTKKEMEEREERYKKEVQESKAATEEIRKEMNDKLAEIMKYLPNYPSS